MARISRKLTEFALSREEIPDATAQMMRLSLFDWTACGIAGTDEPVSRIVHEMALAEAGARQASLLAGGNVPARAAALVNGTVSHALDYDDTHFAHIGHPSVAVIPAALATAEMVGASGHLFMDAATRGIEASIRVGEWLGRRHYEIGFHQTATAGSFGATVAAGRVLELPPDQLSHALGLVATKAAGLKSQFGTMGKPYNAGLAAAAGVEAALLTQAGFVSHPEAIEGPQGFGPTHRGEANAAAFDDLGRVWRFDTISHKFHACCHGTHAMIEALLSVRDEVDPDTVQKITVDTHPRWLSVCDIATPRSGLEAKFSYRLIAAMVLAGQDTGALETFSDAAARDPSLIACRDKVEVTPAEALSEMQAVVTIRTSRGETRRAFDLYAPISLTNRHQKLRAKAQALLGPQAAELEDVIFAERAPDLQRLTALLAQ